MLDFHRTHKKVTRYTLRGRAHRGVDLCGFSLDNPRNIQIINVNHLLQNNKLFDSQNNGAGGYACPRAWPFRCYQMPNEVDRKRCNTYNSGQNYDDISDMGMMDNEGVLDNRGTKTARMYYFEGSKLMIEWTNQHGCGENPRTNCDIILQYACEDTLSDNCGEPNSGLRCGPRDGAPITNNDAERGELTYNPVGPEFSNSGINRRRRDVQASETIPTSLDYSVQADPRFARHEGLDYYMKCRRRERNKGLWIADQGVRDDATGTRQNPGGGRSGLECPEERDYYPYWGPSPWKDIVILTSQTDRCPWYIAESQNIKAKYECVCPSCVLAQRLVPNSMGGCTAAGGTWVIVPAHGIPAPLCGAAPTTRENQLGNPIGGGKSASTYNWTIPYNVPAGQTCILRLRYNISTGDPIQDGSNRPVTIFGTSAQNGGNSPVKDRRNSEAAAYKSFVEYPSELYPAAKLGLAINTNQYGRVFQDRSWSFSIRPPTGGQCSGRGIYNLNVRGKRGNIVQTYPSVEYDFVPSEMYVTDEDCVHVQWTGSDYNPDRNSNDAYGGPPDPNNLNRGRADRHNLVQLYATNQHQHVVSLDSEFTMFDTSRNIKMYLAFLGQPFTDTMACLPIEAIQALSRAAVGNNAPENMDQGNNFLDDDSDRDRHWKNCGKLSNVETPYFDAGPLRAGGVGSYSYMSTRGNSFSNRNQVGILHVQSAFWASGSIVFVVLGSAVMMGLAAAGVVAYRRQNKKRALEMFGGDTAAAAAAAAHAPSMLAFLPFGRRNSPGLAGVDNAPPIPMVPRRDRPGMIAVGGASGGGRAAPAPNMTVTALYNHQASEPGELEFRKGDVITVTRRDDSGWWEGVGPNGIKGIFPNNYVA